MRYLTPVEALGIHQRVMQETGGAAGLRDPGALESALAQPRMTFGGEDLYPTIPEKASALMFSLVRNHPFVDGNKRAGHAVAETFLLLNGFEIDAPVDEQERIILALAAGVFGRDQLTAWLRDHIVGRKTHP